MNHGSRIEDWWHCNSTESPTCSQRWSRLSSRFETGEPRQRGRIVKAATGHAFVVEFDSHEVVLSAQSLDILPEPPVEAVPAKVVKSGRKTAAKTVAVKAAKPNKKTAAKTEPVVPPEVTSSAVFDTNSAVNAGIITTSNADQDVLVEEPAQQIVVPVEPTALIDKADKQENLLDYLNLENEGFIRLVANALLIAGNSPDVVLLNELRFTDLPERVQQQVQTLIRAKLALTLK